jgi:CheY-like chemotaxis protein
MNGVLQHPARPEAEAVPRWLKWTGTGHLLVVDDSEAIRVVVSRIVTRLGFTADIADSGAEAVALFTARPDAYTLAIVDLKIPGMNGIEVLRQLRLVRPSMPAILMSGSVMEKVEGEARTGILNKPFTPELLASALRAQIEP